MDSIILKKILSAGFLFIDIPRTSSTSLRVELGRIYGAPYSKSNTIEKEFAQPQGFPDHLPAIAMKNLLGNENWEKLFIFTLVRNPWDRTLSMYNWRVMVNNIPSSLDFRAYVIRLRDYLSGVKYGNYHDGYNYSNEKLFQRSEEPHV